MVVTDEVKQSTFHLRGVDLAYAKSSYNMTRFNERAVEVASAMHLYERARSQGKDVLEIGAVLPHYLPGWPGMPRPSTTSSSAFPPSTICWGQWSFGSPWSA